MFEKTTTGEWVVLGLSIIIALFVSLSRTFDGSSIGIFILSLIVLFILYWVITKAYPNSQNWGVIIWVIALVGIPIIIIFVLAVIAGLIFGLTGSGTNYQWVKYSNYGISFNHPSSIPINSSASQSSTATYYQGALQFDNPDHQGIIIIWCPKENVSSQEFAQKTFSVLNTVIKKDAPDLTASSIQETTHSGDTIYFVTGKGHDTTLNGKMTYVVMATWEDSPSQRDFVLITGSYESQEDAQSIFDGVLNSIECH